MDKNEINIINDLDKENDDLMAHLGVLQQLSLGEKTNVLKQIKSYDNINLENNTPEKINESNVSKKVAQTEPKNDIRKIRKMRGIKRCLNLIMIKLI